MEYYRLITDDAEFADRWFLGEPIDHGNKEIDARIFTEGRPVDIIPMKYLSVDYGGRVVDFNLAAFDMPVLAVEVADIIQRYSPSGIQRFPIEIEEYGNGFDIVNVTDIMKSLDEKRTEDIMWWKPEDGRPDKVGEYRQISGMKIDRVLVEGCHIFRVKDWEIALIVSEELRNALEEYGATGIKYQLVT